MHKAIEVGRLFASSGRRFSSHPKHLLSALTHMGPKAAPVAPDSPLGCLFSQRHRRGMRGARPVSLPHGAFPELSFPAGCAGNDARSCRAPTVASEWHLVLGCRTALLQHPLLLLFPPDQLSCCQTPGTRTWSWTTRKVTGLPQMK